MFCDIKFKEMPFEVVIFFLRLVAKFHLFTVHRAKI